ncbi:MAG: glycerophosphodiester phosphodiesterase [Acidimicrobiia bacterium]
MPLRRLEPNSGPITFAHRGARADEPENTLPAFRLALELGATGLESDVRLAADGEVVLVHDAAVRRGFVSRVRVASVTAAELAKYGVPRLADLFEAVGADYELSLDLYDLAAADSMLEVVGAAGALDRLWICSGRLKTLEQLAIRATTANLVHSTKRSALEPSVERHADLLASLGVGACNMRHTDWTAGLVGLFHRFGIRAFAWDVQEVRHLRAMIEIGVDAVYSDHVDRMVATVAEWRG